MKNEKMDVEKEYDQFSFLGGEVFRNGSIKNNFVHRNTIQEAEEEEGLEDLRSSIKSKSIEDSHV